MELQSREVIERFREKMHLIEKDRTGSNAYGMTHMDIICEDNTIKQYILAFERYEVIEPPVFLKRIGSDVYIKINDEILYKIAIKEISIDEALSQKLLRVHGDKEIWQKQLKGLKEILPYEHFAQNQKNAELIREAIEEEDGTREKRELEEEWNRKVDLSTIPPEFKFLADAYEKVVNRK